MTPLIATHAFAAMTSLLLGGWQLFFSTKGSQHHRLVGAVWVALMLFVAISSFWIKDLRPGHFSWLHILSVVTIVTVSLGVFDAVRGNRQSHRGNMTGSWIGLAVAFGFAVGIPDRHIPTLVVTDPATAAFAAGAVVVTTITVVFAGRVLASAVESARA